MDESITSQTQRHFPMFKCICECLLIFCSIPGTNYFIFHIQAVVDIFPTVSSRTVYLTLYFVFRMFLDRHLLLLVLIDSPPTTLAC